MIRTIKSLNLARGMATNPDEQRRLSGRTFHQVHIRKGMRQFRKGLSRSGKPFLVGKIKLPDR